MKKAGVILGIKNNWLYLLGAVILGLAIGFRPIFFGILFAAFIVIALFLLYPELGLLLLVTFMPLHVILVQKTAIPGMWKELLLVSIFIFWLVRAAVKKKIVLIKTEVNLPLLLFICYCTMLLLININNFSANIIGLRNLLQYSMIFFLVISLVRGKNNTKKYIFLLLIVGVLIALINTMWFLSRPGAIHNILKGPYHSSTKFLAHGFLGANNYAYYLDALICLSLGLFLFAQSKKNKLLLLIGINILAVSLLLTYSKGGIFALMTAVLLWTVRNNKKLLICLLLLCLIGAFLLPSTMHERFYTTKHYKEALPIRVDKISKNFNLVLANPIFGIELGKVGTVGGDTLYPHNYYMYLLLQTGILGLSIYLWILALFFKTSFRLYKKLDKGFFKGLIAGITMYYITFAISALFAASGEAFLSAFIFWFLGGVVMVVDNDFRYSKAKERMR